MNLMSRNRHKLHGVVVPSTPELSKKSRVAWHRLRELLFLIGAFRHWSETLMWRWPKLASILLRNDVRAARKSTLSDKRPLAKFEKSVFSQFGEDGVLLKLVSEIGITRGCVVEVGAASGEQNCSRILAELGWKAYWIDADSELIGRAKLLGEQLDLVVENRFVTPQNALEILGSLGVRPDLDVLVIDIDGRDFDVLRSILRGYRPSIAVCEFNSEHRYVWKMGSRSQAWGRDWNYGASLQAFVGLFRHHGYELVHVESTGVNAFWVRSELFQGSLKKLDVKNSCQASHHLAGSVGHPRIPICDSPTYRIIDFGKVQLLHPRIVFTRKLADQIEIWILIKLRNRGDVSISSSGERPVHFAYKEVSEERLEPPRSILCASVKARRSRIVLLPIKIRPNEKAHVEIFLVQEGVGWSAPLLTFSPADMTFF